MNEKEKMLKGMLYDSSDPELVALRNKCHKLCQEYNCLEETSERRKEILKEFGFDESIYLQGPIYFDYGCFINIGKNTYANFNLTILDVCPVNIGHDVFIGTGVSIVTPLHPMRYKERNIYFDKEKNRLLNKEYGAPITVGDNCWICSNVTVIGGVTIGSGSVIGAGSVVTHDIPSNVLAAGNPCKVIREIDNEEREIIKEMNN